MIGCKALQDNELSAIMEVLPSQRDKVLFYIGCKTGFRISELLSIEVKDVVESSCSIKDVLSVQRKNMKGKHTSRNVPLSQQAKEMLLSYISSLPKDQQYLFTSQKGGKLSRKQAWHILKQASHAANVSGKVATHTMRKCFAKKVYELSGKDLALTQRALGHKNVNSTISYLSFISNKQVEDVILGV